MPYFEMQVGWTLRRGLIFQKMWLVTVAQTSQFALGLMLKPFGSRNRQEGRFGCRSHQITPGPPFERRPDNSLRVRVAQESNGDCLSEVAFKAAAATARIAKQDPLHSGFLLSDSDILRSHDAFLGLIALKCDICRTDHTCWLKLKTLCHTFPKQKHISKDGIFEKKQRIFTVASPLRCFSDGLGCLRRCRGRRPHSGGLRRRRFGRVWCGFLVKKKFKRVVKIYKYAKFNSVQCYSWIRKAAKDLPCLGPSCLFC